MSLKNKIRSAYDVIDPNNKVRARKTNQCNATALYPRRNLFKIALMAAFILNLCVARGQHATPTVEKFFTGTDLAKAEYIVLEDGDIVTDGTNWYRYTMDRGIVCLETTAMTMYDTAAYMIESAIYFATEHGPKVVAAIETHGPTVVKGIKYTVKEGGEIALQILKVKKEWDATMEGRDGF